MFIDSKNIEEVHGGQVNGEGNNDDAVDGKAFLLVYGRVTNSSYDTLYPESV